MLVHLIADYGTNDPAFAEVTQQLLLHFPSAKVYPLAVPPFSTLATGFWIAQLGLNAGPTPRLIYHNCAPRQDNLEARVNNEGEGLTLVTLKNDVKVIGVWAGYSLSFVKRSARSLHNLKVSRQGSQFRSRDIFPKAVAAIAQGDTSLVGEPIAPDTIPDPPSDRIAWIDGYGNLKTTIPADSIQLEPETKVIVRIGDLVSDAVYSDGSFRVPEGTLAFAPGSSGWSLNDNISPIRWMELFLRGGNAWRRFAKPKINQTVSFSTI